MCVYRKEAESAITLYSWDIAVDLITSGPCCTVAVCTLAAGRISRREHPSHEDAAGDADGGCGFWHE